MLDKELRIQKKSTRNGWFFDFTIELSLNKGIIHFAKFLALSFISYCNANEIINAKTSGSMCSITHNWRNLMIPFGKSPVP